MTVARPFSTAFNVGLSTIRGKPAGSTHTHTHNLEIHRISVSVSVSAANVWANSRPTFDTLSVSAWRELYFGWSAKVSHRA